MSQMLYLQRLHLEPPAHTAKEGLIYSLDGVRCDTSLLRKNDNGNGKLPARVLCVYVRGV